jgi:uncharacterized protein (TIGR02466 family)
MTLRRHFATTILHEPLRARGLARLLRSLADECDALALDDAAGRRWSRTNYPAGYTSYGSLDRLHETSAAFAALRRAVDPAARRFAHALGYDLSGRALAMTDCWANAMDGPAGHTLHLHPGAFLSGTVWLESPRAAPGLKFEDPRLAKTMAAPPLRPDAEPRFVALPARPGWLALWESWLRHEVPAAHFAGRRVSVSFNYGWRARA